MKSAAPISPETGHETVTVVKAVEANVTWRQAMSDLGISLSRPQRSEYRKWLGLNAGEKLNPTNKERFRLMYHFCQAGSGPEFSKRKFVELELSGQLTERLKELEIK